MTNKLSTDMASYSEVPKFTAREMQHFKRLVPENPSKPAGPSYLDGGFLPKLDKEMTRFEAKEIEYFKRIAIEKPSKLREAPSHKLTVPPKTIQVQEQTINVDMLDDENVCRICCLAAIDCVFFACNHFVCCLKCAVGCKEECPICRKRTRPQRIQIVFLQKQCTFCEKNEIDSVFMPCGHMCCCQQCAKSSYCKMCHSTNTSIKIYKS